MHALQKEQTLSLHLTNEGGKARITWQSTVIIATNSLGSGVLQTIPNHFNFFINLFFAVEIKFRSQLLPLDRAPGSEVLC